MKRITFLNPLGLAGRFVTVRLGEELSKQLQAGEEVALIGKDDKPIGYAKAADCWCGDLALVPASVLEMEQNPLQRTYSGLIMGLRAQMALDGSDGDLTPNHKITALILDFTRSSLLQTP